jgi:hypothetical protein
VSEVSTYTMCVFDTVMLPGGRVALGLMNAMRC